MVMVSVMSLLNRFLSPLLIVNTQLPIRHQKHVSMLLLLAACKRPCAVVTTNMVGKRANGKNDLRWVKNHKTEIMQHGGGATFFCARHRRARPDVCSLMEET